MSIKPLFSESDLVSSDVVQSGFGNHLTEFTRITLVTALAGTLIGGGLFLSLNYFQRSIDDFDDRPDSLTQQTFKVLNSFSWVALSAAFYIGVQGLIISQILNIGHYISQGKGAIHYNRAFSLS